MPTWLWAGFWMLIEFSRPLNDPEFRPHCTADDSNTRKGLRDVKKSSSQEATNKEFWPSIEARRVQPGTLARRANKY